MCNSDSSVGQSPQWALAARRWPAVTACRAQAVSEAVSPAEAALLASEEGGRWGAQVACWRENAATVPARWLTKKNAPAGIMAGASKETAVKPGAREERPEFR